MTTMTTTIPKALGALMSLLLLSLLSASCNRSSGSREALALDSISQADTFYMRLPLDSGYLPVAFAVEMQYVYPTNAPEVLTSLSGQMFSDEAEQTPPQQIFASHLERIKADMLLEFEAKEIPLDTYRADTATELGRDDLPSFEWFDKITSRYAYGDEHVVSFVISRDSYIGGAHGTYTEAFHSFDRKTGQLIGEADIFVDGVTEDLAKIIQGALRRVDEQGQEHEVIPLEEIVYSVGEEFVNNNFMVTATGLRYGYNPYEIAAYAYGSFVADLPWSQIAHLIRPDSPVAVYLNRGHE